MDKDFLRFSFKVVVDPSLKEDEGILIDGVIYCHPSVYVKLMNSLPQCFDLYDPEERLKNEIKDLVI
jgi:hypothetical protein